MDDLQPIHCIKGCFTTPTGHPLAGIRVAIVERDEGNPDDLLGVGVTGDRGQFQIAFTRREYNQDPGEHEDTPDLYAVFSRLSGQIYKAVGRCDLPGVRRGDDLGQIPVALTPEGVFVEGLDATPSIDKVITRLHIDDPLVAHCLEEVAPMVESLTGWSGLLDDLPVRINPDFGAHWQTKLNEYIDTGHATASPEVQQSFLTNMNGTMAAYDPFEDALLINATWLDRSNLDALKVVLGHELVHVGQYRNTPDLCQQHRTYANSLGALLDAPEGAERVEIARALRQSTWHQALTRIEGYAEYIQKDYLEKHYNLATFLPLPLTLRRMFNTALKAHCPQLDVFSEVKQDQYTLGREAIRQRHEGEGPARFEAPSTRADKLGVMLTLSDSLLTDGHGQSAIAFAEAAINAAEAPNVIIAPTDLDDMSALATHFQKQGFPTTARRLEALVNEVRHRLLAQEDINITLPRVVIEVLIKSGDHTKALGIFEPLLSDERTRFGVISPETLRLGEDAARQTERAHRHRPALAYRLALLKHADKNSVSARNHRKRAAILLEKLGHPKGADALRSGCDPDTLPPFPTPDFANRPPNPKAQHPPQGPRPNAQGPKTDPLDALRTRADLLEAQGDLQAATALTDDLLQRELRALGQDHPHTQRTMEKLAALMRAQSQWRAAKALYTRLLKHREATLGPDHPHTLALMTNLIDMLDKIDDHQSACERQTHLIEALTRTKGPDHPEIRAAYARLDTLRASLEAAPHYTLNL